MPKIERPDESTALGRLAHHRYLNKGITSQSTELADRQGTSDQTPIRRLQPLKEKEHIDRHVAEDCALRLGWNHLGYSLARKYSDVYLEGHCGSRTYRRLTTRRAYPRADFLLTPDELRDRFSPTDDTDIPNHG
jgi:hypothetical protein